ncbi:MAG: hypothetical protein JWQ63_3591 [Mucilaginibacter sp.]|jgi:hypothetical protein|nr:hypothetical protein [Mucilaginibacter sp.]
MLFLIILILSFASGYFLPWWVVAIAAFLTAFVVGKTSGQSFWSGFSAVFIVWTVLALFKSIPNDHILAKRVATMFHLPHWIFILFVTALIGGLVGGMSALSGLLLKRAFSK